MDHICSQNKSSEVEDYTMKKFLFHSFVSSLHFPSLRAICITFHVLSESLWTYKHTYVFFPSTQMLEYYKHISELKKKFILYPGNSLIFALREMPILKNKMTVFQIHAIIFKPVLFWWALNHFKFFATPKFQNIYFAMCADAHKLFFTLVRKISEVTFLVLNTQYLLFCL